MTDAKKRRGFLALVLFTIFIDMVGLGLIIPVMPQLLGDPKFQYYLLSPEWSIKTAYILLGFLIAAYPIAQFFAAPILGQLSDKFGRKLILAISIAGNVFGYLLFAIGITLKNVPLLFISRAMAGITGGNVSIAQASIADVTKPEDRTKNFGFMGAAFGLGFILGPYLGGKLSDPSVVSWFNATTPFYFASLLSFLNLASILLFFKDPNQKMLHIKINFLTSIKNIVKAFTLGELKTIFATVFLFTAGFTFFTTFFNIFLTDKFQFNQSNIGDLFAYIGICIAITQAVITRAVARRFRESQVLKVSLILNGLTVLLFLWPSTAWQIFLIVPFFAIFQGLSQANSTSIVSRSAPQEIQGEVLGLNTSVLALATAIPPVLSGFIAASLHPYAPIFVSGLVMILAGIFFILFYRER